MRSPREILASEYEAEGRASTAQALRRGDTPSESVLRALRAIGSAQREALAARVVGPPKKRRS